MRTILHIDMNCYYASVEIMEHPMLRGSPWRCAARWRTGTASSSPNRTTRTGMASWETHALCPRLVIVPPHYDLYFKYSRFAWKLYQRYTDEVEPYDLDECWLDVMESAIFGDGPGIAESIRQEIRETLGLTVSVGLLWNKFSPSLGAT